MSTISKGKFEREKGEGLYCDKAEILTMPAKPNSDVAEQSADKVQIFDTESYTARQSTQPSDESIIERFFARIEEAIGDLQQKYGKYCFTIGFHILADESDTEECLNDTWLRTWNSIPPERPQCLKSYVGCITRNLAINMYRRDTAKKREGSRYNVALDELTDCMVPSKDNVSESVDHKALSDVINAYLATLPEEKRNIFVRRYFYMDSIEEICDRYGRNESFVKVNLHRMREGLRKELLKSDIIV